MQIAEYDAGRRKIVAHVGSARTEAELGIEGPDETDGLITAGHRFLVFLS